MTTIGYAVLEIIPSLKGVSDSVTKQLASMPDMGKTAGKTLGSNIAAGVKASESDVKRSFGAYSTHAADAGLSAAGAFTQGLSNGLQGGLGKASEHFSGLENVAGRALEGITSKGGLAALAIGGIGTVALGVGDELYKIGEKWHAVSVNIIAQTGATGDALRGLTDSVRNVAKDSTDSIGDIGDVTAKLSQQLGLSGKPLEEMTRQITELQELTGDKLNIRDLAKVVHGFGLETEKQPELLDKLYDSFTKTGIPVSTMIGLLKDAAPTFRAAKIDIEPLAGILTALNDAGVPAEAAISGVRIAIGKLAKAHPDEDPKKSLGDLITQIHDLANAGDEVSQNKGLELAKTNFGKNYAGLFDAIKSGKLTVDDLNKAFETSGQKIGDVKKATEDWHDALTKTKNQLETELQPAASAVFGGINVMIQNWLIKPFQELNDIVGGIKNTWKNLFGTPDVNYNPGGGTPPPGIPFNPTVPIAAPNVAPPPGQNTSSNPLTPWIQPRASGGSIFGAGTATSDSIPAWLSNGEHVFTADDVTAMGGQGAVYAFRSMLHRAGGGNIAAGLMPDFGGSTSDWHSVGPGWADPNTPPPGGWGPGGKSAYQAYLRGEIPNPDYWLHRSVGGPIPLGADWIPRDPRRNADRQNPSQFPDRGPQGPNSYKGPYNYGGDDVKRPGIWEGGTGWWGTHGLPYQGKIRFPKDRFNPNDPNRKNRKNVHGYAGGGAVGPDVSAAEKLVGHPYSQGTRYDCSGVPSRIINAALGIDGGLMTTKTAQAWLAARGFVDGLGGPGQISVGWYDRGPNPNDGHMAMTLSDGRHAESGGSHNAFLIGAGASGADSAQFDHHMHLALAAAISKGPAAPVNSGTVSGEGAPTSGSSGGGSGVGGAGPLPSSISGLSSFGLAGLGSGVGTTGTGSDLSKFGNAAAAAVSGQVSSALGVFGVGDNPPFLQAATKLLGGIKVGGHAGPGKSDGSLFNGANPLGSFGQGSAGSSAVPLSASSTGTGTPPPDDAGNVHGTRAGQAPGPVFNTTISAFDTKDALRLWDNKKNQIVAAKLAHF